ncbi:helix-turn-helix domain-containing protein [Paenibacillus radicis (ex Xue et al. 2023)]|uniref:Helix-turn-helix domain-containing protein n=1 Tax=Paenibacillus radicis (ex Xue et al. 2023) TaxID=2972489 RepID=A0ABT1YL42_9BACL|nr:helix-turn-helix transcriptional regulator [Paenibacillus radicis (ex Xue et al. 2023)]MCR8633902.1 helix-turn-helix domain-containing protein [Paenibacillus radicis (ex Xue et al. 2023)]
MPLELIFGKVVKSLRIKKDITQEQLALDSTLGRTYISELENGKYQPTLTSLFDIAKALKMNPSDLVRLVELEFDNQSH